VVAKVKDSFIRLISSLNSDEEIPEICLPSHISRILSNEQRANIKMNVPRCRSQGHRSDIRIPASALIVRECAFRSEDYVLALLGVLTNESSHTPQLCSYTTAQDGHSGSPASIFSSSSSSSSWSLRRGRREPANRLLLLSPQIR